MQLDLFNTEEMTILQEQISKVKQSSDNVRRGIFARHNELCKLFLAQQKELDELKLIVSRLNQDVYEDKVIELHQMTMIN